MPRYKKVAAKHKVTKYYISAKTIEYMKINFVILLVCATAFFLPDAFAEIKVETVVDGLKIPWELVFAPDGSIYFTERDGNLWQIESDGTLRLIAEFPASNTYEGGLLGLALDPDFEKNNFLYLYQTYVELPSCLLYTSPSPRD